ncbi:MAG: hypothetical protein NTV46_20510 [Verrucomicrobia bacterium]|nr:hypothetical protein [Verrucomicrobiota bacterium]
MVKLLKRENSYPGRVAKDSFGKSLGGGFFGCGRLRGHQGRVAIGIDVSV